MASAADNDLAKVSGYIAKQAGVGFYEEAVLTPMVDTQYSEEYGTKSGGARVGNTIRVRMPAQFVATDTYSDPSITANTIQAIEEETKVLTLNSRPAVHGEINTEQVTLEIEANGSEYSERVLQPMGKALVAAVESEGFKKMALEAQNTFVYDVAATAVGFDPKALRKSFVQVRAMLDKQLAPKGDRCTVLGSDAELEVSDSVIEFFHSQREIEKAYKEGKMGVMGGLTWMASNMVWTRTNGAGGDAFEVAAYTAGSEFLTLTAIGDLEVGDKLEFDSIYLVHPQTKVAYGNKLQRAVKAINGDVITIDPIWGPVAGPGLSGAGKQNASALPVATDTLTALGTKGADYLCMPVWQKKAITLGSADLYLPRSVEMSSRNKVHGVGQRFIRDYQIVGDTLPNRLEALIIWDFLRPQWSGVVEWLVG